MSENPHNKKEIDGATGVETTGHEWDGLKELNNPLPRWWVWIFIVTFIWSIGYWIVFPAWPVPGGATEGVIQYTQPKELAASQKEIMARQDAYMREFSAADIDEIMKTPKLYEFAMAGGGSAFRQYCATCHGQGAAGGKGYPNLNDDDWIWGGRPSDIMYTITHGIRSTGDDDTRVSMMPAFGREGVLNRTEILAVVDYVLTLSGSAKKTSYAKGEQIFKDNCAACHGDSGKGSRELGAPNLSDGIWLYGGDRETIYQTVYNARSGMMPDWGSRLDPQTIKQLTVYVHELGGGEPEEVAVEPVQAPVASPVTPSAQQEE